MLDDGTGQLDPSVMSYLQGQPQQIGGDAPPVPSPDMPQVPSVTDGTLPSQGTLPADVGQPSVLPPAVQQAAQTGFQPQPDYQLSAKQAAPVQKADAAADKAFEKAQQLQAVAATHQAAYDATPEGMQQKAYDEQRAADAEQARNAVTQGNIDAKQGAAEADITAKAAIDMNTQVAAQQKQRDADIVEVNRRVADSDKATSIAASKVVDPNRYWDSLGTGQKIATKMAIIMSGYANGLAGHPEAANQAAASLQDDIRQDVDAQKTNMGQANAVASMKRNSLDDYMKIAGNRDAAGTMKQVEMSKVVQARLLANAAQWKNPSALVGAQNVVAVMQAKDAAALSDLAGKRVAEKNTAIQQANERSQIGIAAGHLALARKQEAHSELHQDREDATNLLKEQNAGKAAVDKSAAEIADRGVFMPTGGVVKNQDGTEKADVQPLKNQDGATYLVPKELAKDVALKQEGQIKAIDAIDQLRKLREEGGGNLTHSTADARAKIQQYERAIVGMHDAAGITRFSGDVIDLMEKQLSAGKDPTTILANLGPTLDLARDNVVKDFNGTLTAAHYTGTPVSVFDPLSVSKAPVTPEDQAFKHALVTPHSESTDNLAREFGQPDLQSFVDANPGKGATEWNRSVQAASSNAGGIDPSRQRVIDNLAGLARSSDKQQAANAVKQLQTIVDQAQLPAMQKAARDALSQATLANAADTTEQVGTRSASTAREEMPK